VFSYCDGKRIKKPQLFSEIDLENPFTIRGDYNAKIEKEYDE
jgi:hypothetical protein